MNCRLCQQNTKHLLYYGKRTFMHCEACDSIQLALNDLPDRKVEKKRYTAHNNDSNDDGYVRFLQPMIDVVLQEQEATNLGLDFGSGPQPVLSDILQSKGYAVSAYDPIFKNETSILDKSFDYILCCEVMEHFHNPYGAFKKLHSLLKPGGKLYCKTMLYDHDIDFDKWWYKNDITHVFFYSQKSLKYIQHAFGFSDLSVQEELICFKK